MISATVSSASQSIWPPIIFHALIAKITSSSGVAVDFIGKSAEASHSVIFFQHARLSHCAY